MAVKIPVWAPRFVEFTKVEPVLQRVNSTGALTEIGDSGDKAGYSMGNRYAVYIDINQVMGVGRFFDDVAEAYRNYRVLILPMATVIVTESDASIRALLDARDCDTLCTTPTV